MRTIERGVVQSPRRLTALWKGEGRAIPRRKRPRPRN
jgi:hypothetical protein